jgi:hypothetical protein
MRSTRHRKVDTPGSTPTRRRLRLSGVSHATAVAYLALFMAMSGTAVAATGGTFILGQANTAENVSTLTNSAGPALSLRSPSGSPPLQVNRTVKVDRLNADLLDGIDSTAFARLGMTNTGARTTLSNPDGVPLRLTSKPGAAPLQVGSPVKVANLNADLLDGKDSSDFVTHTAFAALQADHAALTARVAELEGLLTGVSRETIDGHPTVRFSDMNVQIVNGTGTTAGKPNGRGNLIIGYSAQPPGAPAASISRAGSHYLIVGDEHAWGSYGGIVAGLRNVASGAWATVSGGRDNTASGSHSSVSGGHGNTASAPESSVSGGGDNTANTVGSSVSGGANNWTDLPDSYYCFGDCGYASVTGGKGNRASGYHTSILGGSGITLSDPQTCHPSCP